MSGCVCLFVNLWHVSSEAEIPVATVTRHSWLNDAFYRVHSPLKVLASTRVPVHVLETCIFIYRLPALFGSFGLKRVQVDYWRNELLLPAKGLPIRRTRSELRCLFDQKELRKAARFSLKYSRMYRVDKNWILFERKAENLKRNDGTKKNFGHEEALTSASKCAAANRRRFREIGRKPGENVCGRIYVRHIDR